MVGKTKAPTAEERRHMGRVRELGCIACRKAGRPAPAEIHHVTEGGRRLGHRHVLPLCAWHHRGESEAGVRPSMAEQVFGPSFARSPRSFADQYGTQAELLAEVDRRLEKRYGAEEVG